MSMKLFSNADIHRIEKRLCRWLRNRNWHVEISRSEISDSVYLYCRKRNKTIRVRVSDHPPSVRVAKRMDVMIHPGCGREEGVKARAEMLQTQINRRNMNYRAGQALTCRDVVTDDGCSESKTKINKWRAHKFSIAVR
jgi:hypothetical protein